MLLTFPDFVIRHWRQDDASSLTLHANDRRIWINLRDRFPHPYTPADAERFLGFVAATEPRSFFAIAKDGQAIGGIGYTLQNDVERVSAEVGYWLGTDYWGRGIMTAALRGLTPYVFGKHPELTRLYALPFAWSSASIRVLEKAGYRLEGRMRQSAIKDGRIADQLLYAILRDEIPSQSETPLPHQS
jgi:RimJ/RimL family protein N-acetyltransferase